MENGILEELPPSVTIEIVPLLIPNYQDFKSTSDNVPTENSQTGESSGDEEPLTEAVTGIHFLTDSEENYIGATDNNASYEKKRNELLEYFTCHDGSVICKLCGEVLASRTHWYRHKYKLHVNSLVNSAPLFKCVHCNVFFKSRKGFIGHLSSRHTNSSEKQEETSLTTKEEVLESVVDSPKISKRKDIKSAEWEEQREREEKLVAEIIDRVRKECEAQGAAVTRKGYSRRSTIMMNSCV